MEKNILEDMSVAGVPPREVLVTIKKSFPENSSALKTIYNSKYKMQLSVMECRSAMQHLMKLLTEKHYVYFDWADAVTDHLIDIMWSHPKSSVLCKCFPSILLLDCTYKTNQYNMPLLEIVDMTSTGRTFSIAHAFLAHEREENYEWVLTKLKHFYLPDKEPEVIVSDREWALINGIKKNFPRANLMMCLWHMGNNVITNCKPEFKTNEVFEMFLQSWKKVVHAPTEDEFWMYCNDFQKDWVDYPKSLKYIRNQCLEYKEYYAFAWTNKIKHRDNRTTTRAESSHAQLKKHLGTSRATFVVLWSKMDNMLCLQHTEIKSTFERSLGAIRIPYQVPLLKQLRGKTPFFALDLIVKEMGKISCVALDASVCDHLNRLVYGLPCAHEIYKYHSDGLPIPIEIVDDHWRQLNYIPQVEESLEFVHTAEFAYIKKLFDSSTTAERKVLLLKLREIALPATTSILEPKIEKHKGRPSECMNKSISKQVKRQKSTKRDPSTCEIAKTANEILSQASVNKKLPPKRKNSIVKFDKCDVKTTNSDFMYLAYLPAFLHQYIDNVEDVMGDGNCRFHCIAEQVDELNSDWREARKSILAELMKN